MPSMKPARLEKVRKHLLAYREELKRLAEATEEARQPVELDQSTVGRLSRMDALQGQAMALETERRRAIEMQRIEQTLHRIDEGEYGYCVNCGEEIAPKRLEHDPTTPICIDCAQPSHGG